MEPHAVATKGFSMQTEAYETARPNYPPTVVEFLLTTLGLSSTSNVIDLAAGTGKMSRLLAPHVRLTAVEPNAGMIQKFKELQPDIKIMEGTAWHMPCETESVDAIVVAQAFHWFDNMDALREFYRALEPGGHVALVWNMEDKAVPWVAKVRRLYEQFDGNVPQYRHATWKKVFEDPEAAQLFTPLQTKFFESKQRTTIPLVWQRALSKSYISALHPEPQEELKHKILAVMEEANAKGELGEDKEGYFDYPHSTEVVWFQRK